MLNLLIRPPPLRRTGGEGWHYGQRVCRLSQGYLIPFQARGLKSTAMSPSGVLVTGKSPEIVWTMPSGFPDSSNNKRATQRVALPQAPASLIHQDYKYA